MLPYSEDNHMTNHTDGLDAAGVAKVRARYHAVERTSPKGVGQDFVGTCALCGKPGLTFADMREPCENVRGLSQEEALIEAIEGPNSGEE